MEIDSAETGLMEIGSVEMDEVPRCSARGCRAPAEIELRWRNPALHAAPRTKRWLACGEHATQLSEFLDRRGFLLAAVPLTPPPERAEPAD